MFLKIVGAATAVLALAACEVSTVTEAPTSALNAAAVLTPHGYGPVRIGMTHEQVVTAFGGNIEKGEGDPRNRERWLKCHVVASASRPTAAVMIENGKASRVELWDRTVSSDRGVKMGDSEAKVRGAYPKGLKEMPHVYADPPAKYLIWYETPGKAGMRFDINEQGIVSAMAGGGPSIEYVEGCL